MNDGPLDGVRVIDLTHARAGPTCTRQLADFGADVIRVSHPHRGFRLGGSDDQNLMRDKRSILVDLSTEHGHEVFLRLCDTADVVVENFRPQVKYRLKVGPDTVWARNARIVYASISGYGQDGPHADRPSVDQIAQGVTGLMSVTGPPGTGPWRVGIAVSDTAAGTFCAQGVLAALFAREKTGRGQWVHTSLVEALLNLMDFQAARWLNEGEVPGQAGNDHPTVFPMGTYAAADGLINIAPMGTWERFCETIGAPALAVDARFADPAERTRHRDDLRTELEAVLATASAAEWVERLSAAGYPAGPVLRVDEAFADPQVGHLGMVATVHHATEGDVHVLRHPVTLTDTPTSVRHAAALPGADTAAVLRELGYDDSAVDALVREGSVALGVAG